MEKISDKEIVRLLDDILKSVVYPSIRDARDYYPDGEAAARYRESLAKKIKEIISDLTPERNTYDSSTQ